MGPSGAYPGIDGGHGGGLGPPPLSPPVGPPTHISMMTAPNKHLPPIPCQQSNPPGSGFDRSAGSTMTASGMPLGMPGSTGHPHSPHHHQSAASSGSQGGPPPLPTHHGGGSGGSGGVPGSGGENRNLQDHLKSKIEVMELSDLHHPSCKLNQHSREGSFDHGVGADVIDGEDLDDRSPLHDMSSHSHHSHHSRHSHHSHMGLGGGPGGPGPPGHGIMSGDRRGSDVSDAFLSPEAFRASQAVEFIAEHLRNEDEYVQVMNGKVDYTDKFFRIS